MKGSCAIRWWDDYICIFNAITQPNSRKDGSMVIFVIPYITVNPLYICKSFSFTNESYSWDCYLLLAGIPTTKYWAETYNMLRLNTRLNTRLNHGCTNDWFLWNYNESYLVNGSFPASTVERYPVNKHPLMRRLPYLKQMLLVRSGKLEEGIWLIINIH